MDSALSEVIRFDSVNPATGRLYIDQRGVRPGAEKLALLKEALALRKTPGLYTQNGKGDEAIVYVRLFDPCSSLAWLVLEWDGEDDIYLFAVGCPHPEYGYESLEEIAHTRGRMGIGIEIDTCFVPMSLGQAKSR